MITWTTARGGSVSESVAAATAPTVDGSSLPPGARALLRWLPAKAPSGAFAGQHDPVHCPEADLHALVGLWWSDRAIHPGDRVGPPRGGLAPGHRSSYCVALPAGGYLLIEDGVLSGWRARAVRQLPLVRADGQEFDPGRHSVVHPYFRRQYARMTPSAISAALTSAGHDAASPEQVAEVLAMTRRNEDPVVCGCRGGTRTTAPAPLSLVIPESLLVDAPTLRVLLGEAGAAEAAATLWRLSASIWEPERIGCALAAEAAARNCGEPARGWPESPITEQAVAHVAAQAVRFHGADVVPAIPAWLLGWVMIAAPVLAAGRTPGGVVAAALDAADRVRVARVEAQWHAMASARVLLSRASSMLHRTDDPIGIVVDAEQPPIDLRRFVPANGDDPPEQVLGLPLREAVRLTYRSDVRTWFGIVAERWAGR